MDDREFELRRALIAKFPPLDLTWTPETVAKWWELFTVLWAMVKAVEIDDYHWRRRVEAMEAYVLAILDGSVPVDHDPDAVEAWCRAAIRKLKADRKELPHG